MKFRAGFPRNLVEQLSFATGGIRIYSTPMTDTPANPAPAESREVLLDLNFVPAWARTPSSAAAPGHIRGGDDDDRCRPRDAGQRGRRDGDRGKRGERPRHARPDHAARAPARPAAEDVPSDVLVEFLPERAGLAPLARILGRTGRAYALFEVAATFLSKPEYCAVRLTRAPAAAGGVARQLFQCDECKTVFLERDAAATHALAAHFERWYQREECEAEPPKGAFVCIARCRRSGELLGPPNYHAFNERLLELHQQRFSHIPLDEYRKDIENIHDPDLIARWMESMKRQVQFKVSGSETVFPRFSDVERHFQEHHAAQVIKTAAEFVVPGAVAAGMPDRRLQRLVREACEAESRFPLRMSIPIRLAFRRMGLNLFKTAGGATFLTAVLPNPVDPAQTVPEVRAILEHLAAHPGCTRDQLLQGMATGAGEADSVRKHLTTHLRWLVERGHVIEFADGRMAVPATAVERVQLAHHSGAERRRRHRGGRRGSSAGAGKQ